MAWKGENKAQMLWAPNRASPLRSTLPLRIPLSHIRAQPCRLYRGVTLLVVMHCLPSRTWTLIDYHPSLITTDPLTLARPKLLLWLQVHPASKFLCHRVAVQITYICSLASMSKNQDLRECHGVMG